MRGCLRNVFAMVGCATTLVAVSVAAWHYRHEIEELFHRVTANVENPFSDASSSGRPSPAALRSAIRKNAEMESSRGTATVVLTAAELASMVEDGIAPAAREALDSIKVTLYEDGFTLDGVVLTQVFAGAVLGPFAAMLGERERIVVSGPAYVRRPGAAAWEPNQFQFGAFSLPQAAIPMLINQITGGTDGTLPIRVPPNVGDLRIQPSGVTFYRR